MGPLLKKLVNHPQLRGRVRVVFKHFPLNFHKQARPAAAAIMAAHAQGRFWRYYKKVYANPKNLSASNYKRWARELGLDMRRFNAHMRSGSAARMIERDLAEGRQAHVRGTPSVYINGRKYKGSGGYSADAFIKVFRKYNFL